MTKKKLIKKTIKKAKKKAVKLTKEEAKIVAIMKDAVAQLRVEAYVASPGTYVDYTLQETIEDLDKTKDKKQLKDLLPKLVTKKKPCEICAKGAIFLSGIRKFNNFSVGDAKSEILDDVASEKACELVGENNADKIERYFEIWSHHFDSERSSIEKWAEKYPDPTDRLIAILQNAIKNKGTFTP